jgi:hypothetical protein
MGTSSISDLMCDLNVVKKQAKALKKSCNDDMILFCTHECKNSSGEFFKKKFYSSF